MFILSVAVLCFIIKALSSMAFPVRGVVRGHEGYQRKINGTFKVFGLCLFGKSRMVKQRPL